MNLHHGAFGYGVLLGASLTALYGGLSRLSRLSRFLGDFFSRQGYF